MSVAIIVVLCISICLVVLSIVLGRLLYSKNLKKHKDISTRRSYVLTPFQIFLLGFFLSAFVLFIPIYFYDYFATDSGFIRGIKTILLSIHNTIRLFILDGDFEIIKNAVDANTVGDNLANVFTTYSAIIFVMAPVVTAGVVLSFFKNVSASVKYFCAPKADIYVMSELNDRSIALAQDILTNPTVLGKKLVIFTDVFEKEEEEKSELIEQARRLGAICFKKNITDINLKPNVKGITRKFYFVGDDEDANLRQSLVMIARCRENEVFNTSNTQFFVLSNSVESETLLNSADKGNMRVRRMSLARNLAIDTLQKRSIFEKAVVKDEEKLINIVIVGLGGYGQEFFKTISWCGQMKGYKLNIHLFDMIEDIESQIRGFAPEVVKYNHKKIEGEPFYDIYYHNAMDVKSQEFLEELSLIDNITTVYVTLGDDELNIETAMRIRMILARKGNNDADIMAIVYSSIKNETIKQNGIKDVSGNDYAIDFIGSMEERYTLNFIEQNELEQEGLRIHLSWSNTVEEKKANELLYEKYEYNRRSSMAQALHGQYREKLGLKDSANVTEREDRVMEHNRWNAYMRAEGYVYGSKKNHVARTHTDLVPFDSLTKSKQELDKTIKK